MREKTRQDGDADTARNGIGVEKGGDVGLNRSGFAGRDQLHACAAAADTQRLTILWRISHIQSASAGRENFSARQEAARHRLEPGTAALSQQRSRWGQPGCVLGSSVSGARLM